MSSSDLAFSLPLNFTVIVAGEPCEDDVSSLRWVWELTSTDPSGRTPWRWRNGPPRAEVRLRGDIADDQRARGTLTETLVRECRRAVARDILSFIDAGFEAE